jgi:hypothetical protein
MSRKIIMLDRLSLGSIDQTYRVAFWLEVPVERQGFYANPSAASVVRDITAEELSDLRCGRFVEQVENFTKPASATEEQARAMLEGDYMRRQEELNARNPWDRYGTYWDGGKWFDVVVT